MTLTAAPEKISVAPHLAEALRQFTQPDSTALERAALVELCCAGAWTQKYLNDRHDAHRQFFARMAIAAAAGHVFERVLRGGVFRVMTASETFVMRESATSLWNAVSQAPYLPVAARAPEFRRGLDSLCKLQRSTAPAVKSRHGDEWKRWAALEFGRWLLRSFNEAPVKVIAELMGLVWGPVDEAWVRKQLTVDVVTELRLELLQEQQQAAADEQARIRTGGIINNFTRLCTPEQALMAEQFRAMAYRLLGGQSPVENDREAVSMCMQLLATISDSDAAAELGSVIQQAAADFGLV